MWLRAAALTDLPDGQGKGVEVGEHLVALFRVGKTVYAIANRCSHAAAPLSLGRLDGTEVTCGRHGWVFDVTSGASIPHNPPFDVPSYAVKIAGNDVFVELP